ncbi:hypothetical protein [Bifidobacterium favimelis]|uniref:Uncharacterized protein n=1 Tax=Bifidobacterium favimelis TaxID=3122979 RepID=A0ABU8ZQK0_9BIFI
MFNEATSGTEPAGSQWNKCHNNTSHAETHNRDLAGQVSSQPRPTGFIAENHGSAILSTTWQLPLNVKATSPSPWRQEIGYTCNKHVNFLYFIKRFANIFKVQMFFNIGQYTERDEL